ncbi:MAG TPA: adenylate/guanylate cyclase domain-containing protein [Candidatus Limnocylindria bacterium]
MERSAALPSGTLTFLFSDIEGSTRLLQELGPAWNAALEDHRRLTREAIAEHAGTEVDTEGDSFFVVFPTAPDAVRAALAAQRKLAAHPWPGGAVVRVRIGLHTGSATIAGGSYAGLDVHRAARIMAAAHGGQVLLSEVTRALAATALGGDVTTRDLGEHRLRDLDSPERLHQLVAPGLATDFPALRTADAVRSNLPAQPTSFLGREREIGEVSALLEDARLVTLTGPGGIGKTRLAIECAARLADRFPAGVWFVALAPIVDPDLVPMAVAQALRVPENPGRTPLERVLDLVGQQHMLMVFDNFEQVTDAAETVASLLAGAPGLAVIVTSRFVLHLAGEHEYPVPPLEVPDVRHLPDVARLTQYEAVALFIERAKATRPGFVMTDDNAPAVGEISVRLDGLPLAIELAAARVRLLTPQEILVRLSDRLGLLVAGPRDVPERQRTLRGAIEWSHDLLDPDEQRLFRALSVFRGGARLEAVEEICGSAGADILTDLASLVDKSLVRAESTPEGAGETHYVMLETLREFAAERLHASGDADDLERRHAEWYAHLADRLAPSIMGEGQRAVLDRLEEEHDNLRAAMSWAIEHDRADVALLLAARLWRMWQMRGYLDEGGERIERALALPSAAEYPQLRADALEAAGGVYYWRGDVPPMRRSYEQALEARRALGEPDGVAEALYNLSFAFSYVARLGGDTDIDRARELQEQALELFRQTGNRSGEGRALWALGATALAQRDFPTLERSGTQAEPIFRDLGDRYYLGWSLWSIVVGRIAAGRLGEARAPAREALQLFAQADDVSGYAGLLDAAAIIAFREGDRLRAARLSGAVDELARLSGLDARTFGRALLDFEADALASAQDTRAAWQEGLAMERSSAIAYALEGLSGNLDEDAR